MNIRRLECFMAVAECLNFTAAAKRVFIGQSALSQQIAALEEELGVKLFDRTKHSVRLTTAGEVLFKEAQAVFTRIDEAVQRVRMTNSGSEGSLKIGFLALVAGQFLPQVASAFLHRHPRIDLNLLPLYVSIIHQELINGNIDLGITRPGGLPATGFICKTIYHDRLSIVVRHDHPLAGQDKISFASLASESLITYPREVAPYLFERIHYLCAKNGFVPNLVRQPSRVESLLFMIEAGVGVSILNHHIGTLYANPKLKFVEIDTDEDISNDLVLAWKTNNTNPAISLFVEEFDSVFKGLNIVT